MIAIIVTKDSEISRIKALGVEEGEPYHNWRWDKPFSPYTQREYGHQYKTRKTGKK